MVEDLSGVVRFTSYEVRTIDVKPNGVLHFSYRLDWKGKEVSSEPVLRIDGYKPVAHYQNQNSLPLLKIEYPAIDWENDCSAQEVGYTRPAEVVHTLHNGFPVSGVVHASHEGISTSLPSQQQNMGYYPPPMPHMYPPGPPPPLPPHMLYHHQPHSPPFPHLGSPFHGYPPPPPPPVNPWAYGGGYDHRSSHGGGESRPVEEQHTRDRGLGDHYPNY